MPSKIFPRLAASLRASLCVLLIEVDTAIQTGKVFLRR